MAFYHYSPTPLDIGSVIKPGNWGRILSCYSASQSWTLTRELAFETVRLAHYSKLPSRLASTYVFDNVDDAMKHQATFNWSILYEVEMVNPDEALHRGCFDLLNFDPNAPDFLPTAMIAAHKYWRGDNVVTAEIISPSPLRIVRTVMEPAGYKNAAYQTGP